MELKNRVVTLVADLMQEIEKDTIFYDESGAGSRSPVANRSCNQFFSRPF